MFVANNNDNNDDTNAFRCKCFPTPMTNKTDSVANMCDEEMIDSKLLSQIGRECVEQKARCKKTKQTAIVQ